MLSTAFLVLAVLGIGSDPASTQDLPPLPRGRSITKPLPPLPQRARTPSPARPAPAPPRPGTFTEEARVERVVIDAHVTDDDGEPIRDLTAADFLVKVDGKRVPLESVEWVSASTPESAASQPGQISWTEAPTMPEPVLAYPPGRVIVLFYQTNYEPVRIAGFMRMAQYTDHFLETLLETDRVAV
ncbi:MAG TPA: hypothetical protein VK392_09770, partial [Thermoanaerobaculia bacterium]|nr:hypothetical protein [Thermoanaerobaculia bacterium]